MHPSAFSYSNCRNSFDIEVKRVETLTRVLLLAWLSIFLSGLTVLAQPAISLTFDDGITQNMPGYRFEEWNGKILDHLDDAGIKAAFFVTGSNKLDDRGKSLLKSWDEKGHKIGNHTFSHPNYNGRSITFQQFSTEFIRTDSVIRHYKNYYHYFRFPYLKEGDTEEKVSRFRTLLADHGYQNGYVTIDASDWYINSRLINRLKAKPNAEIGGFRQYYLDHLYERAMYYEELAFKLTGRHVSHTLLLHHNLTSALFVGDLVKMFRAKGWRVISADEAYKDAIFAARPSNIPAGESLIWALAKESGKFDAALRYPAEDSEYEKEKMDKLGL